MQEKSNYIFLFLGLFSIILALLDFLIEADVHGGILAVAWGLLFIILFFKKEMSIRAYNFLLGIVIAFIVVSGILKLLYKLDLIYR